MTQPLNRMRQKEKNRHKNRPCKRAFTPSPFSLLKVPTVNYRSAQFYNFVSPEDPFALLPEFDPGSLASPLLILKMYANAFRKRGERRA